MLEEHISKNLAVPFVVLDKGSKRYYLCENGVIFTKDEYLTKFNTKEALQKEYERRKQEDKLYDYAFAKKTGLLRKKKVKQAVNNQVSKSIKLMCLALTFVSIGSMYISTVHTATYLFDYVDIASAWIMSTVVTVYCSTAFEVIVLFFDRKRYVLSIIFAFLWTLVTAFSMATTVSVFYDRFNFNTVITQEENKEVDGTRLALNLLRKKEDDLRHSIKLKEADIEYRRRQDYATTAVRLELNKLQDELQKNLSEQQKLIFETPTASKSEDEVVKKESLFAYLSRLIGLDGGMLEFIMSTLSAVFINLISPFTVTTVISLLNKKEE